jgi:hypothetical protein
MRRLAFLLGLILAAPAGGQAAPAEVTAALGETTLHLPLPSGYCAIDQARPEEAKLFNAQAAALQPLSLLLGLAIACDELDAYRADKTQFGRYLEFMATEHDGQPIRRPDAERGGYLAELAGQLPQLDAKTIADTANQRTQQVGVTTSVQRMGLLGQDEAALYLGGVATYNDVAVTNVSALTLAGGWALSASFYRNKADADAVPLLLDAAKAEARALVAANAGSDAPPAGTAAGGSDNSWILALAAAIALLAVSVVSFIRRRR